MAFALDLAGQTFGRLTVIERVENIGRQVAWRCRCECGTIVVAWAGRLRDGRTKSCGCRKIDQMRTQFRTHGARAGRALPVEYVTWKSMKARCLNPANARYRHYGGRGIAVCPQWMNDYPAFLRDMGPRPSARHSIDRIDNDGNYEPGNCRWTTPDVQRANRRPHGAALKLA